MRIFVFVLVSVLMSNLNLNAAHFLGGKNPSASAKVLVIAGGKKKAETAFAGIKSQNTDLVYEVMSYPSHEKLGAGNNVILNLDGLFDYAYLFISIDQGTLSEETLTIIGEYVKAGGKAFLLWDSNARNCFTESMANNANTLLEKLGVDDEVKFEKIDFKSFSRGSILPISDKTRKYFTSNKSLNWIKNRGNCLLYTSPSPRDS